MHDIPGFDSSFKVPTFAAQIQYAAGPIIGQGALNVLLIGLKTSAGNLVVDSEVRQVFSREDAITAAGEGSQLALMAIAAFKANPNCNLYLAAPTESGGTAPTVTMVISGSWTTPGTIVVTIAGVPVSISVGASDAIDTVGANIVARINGTSDLPFTAAYNAGADTVTLTGRNKGAHQRDWIIYQDLSLAPSGLAIAITGSAAVNSFGQVTGVRAGAAGTGTGAEDYTTILTKVTTKRYARIASGDNASANAILIKNFIAAQAAVTIQIYNMAIFGANSTQGAATTLAQTNLNDVESQVIALRNCETHPAIMAAGMAAVRAATEGDQPVPDYDNYDCSRWIVPTRFDTDTWLTSEMNALLNAGVTPLKTENNVVKVVRAITTYCLNGANQDERCLDIGDAVFPPYAVYDLQNLYSGSFRPGNQYVQDNPQEGEDDPPTGVAFPDLWELAVKRHFKEVFFKNKWIKDTFSGDNPLYPIEASFNAAAQRIQSVTPFVVRRVQHQLSIIARQVAPS